MSRYIVGDSVLVKGTVCGIDVSDDKCSVRVNISEHGQRYWFAEENVILDMSNVETIPQEEVMKSAYEQGLNDAWELAKKVVRSPKLVENAQIFLGKNIVGIERESLLIQFFELTPQEALAKMKAYEEAQEIKVGEIVSNKGGIELLVTAICNDESRFDGIKTTPTDKYGKLGATYSGMIKKNFTKTGKHIDIQQILEQIGGE